MPKISRWPGNPHIQSGSVRVGPSLRWPPSWIKSKLRARVALEACGFVLAVAATAYSAILVKERGIAPALAMSVREVPEAAMDPRADQAAIEIPGYEVEVLPRPDVPAAGGEASAAWPAETRWFNGRPVRPTMVLRMRVTAYSPDARSCGDSADGITATLHSVETNGFQLVAADPRVLKYGSLVTVPGYADNAIVPVLDCGGKIKGHRLDLLYPTHEQARKWGSQWHTVTVWGYADGKPACNPRKLR
jgi:3D (Asp-Asp-Asp) domain-containing protein